MDDRVGQQLGNYRLTRLLGRGGFAEVYLGEHLRLGTQAAIKVLYTRLANPDDVEGFEQEARTIARLKHLHIVRVLDYDVEEDTPFLVMDYASGGTLRKRHPKGTILPLTTIITYVKQIADALQYAHDQRVIHRDVKPDNMLVGEHDVLLLSDFGIAIAAQSSRYQNTQNMGGTMAYIAPEQIQGHPRTASDQYSMGIVVYEWLSGGCPFHGSITEIVAQHLAVPPPSLHEKHPMISPDVEQVVLTALEKDPHKRFPSVQAFATAIEQACEKATTHLVTRPTMASPKQPASPADTGATISSNRPSRPTSAGTASSTPLTTNTARDDNTRRTILTANSGKAGQTVFTPKSASHMTTLAKRDNHRAIVVTALIVILALLLIGSSFVIIPSFVRSAHRAATPTAGGIQISSSDATYTADAAFISTVYANSTATAYTKATKQFSPPTGWNLVLDDPLSDNSRGYNWDENGTFCQFTGGTYHVGSNPDPPFYTGCMARATNFGNFAFQVQMTITQDNCGGIQFHSHIVTFDSGPSVVVDSFDVCQDGSYFIRNDNGGGGVPAFEGSDPAIKKGLHQSNTLAIIVNGNTIEVYVNQRFINSGRFDKDKGPIGFSASSAEFSNAKVWAP